MQPLIVVFAIQWKIDSRISRPTRSSIKTADTLLQNTVCNVIPSCNAVLTRFPVFQAFKFLDYKPELAERIRKLPSSRDALQEAGRLRRLQRPDWFDVNIGVMELILELKFTQHPRLGQMLLGTGSAHLVEDSPTDAFWGIGEDGQGRNELGLALMRLRDKMRADRGTRSRM
jgi:ribA/ribD-fused uncharacterized protein